MRTKNNGREGGQSSFFVHLFYISVTRQASSIFIRRFKNVHGTWLNVVFQGTKCIPERLLRAHVWDSLWETGISQRCFLLFREKFLTLVELRDD